LILSEAYALTDSDIGPVTDAFDLAVRITRAAHAE